MAATRRLAAIMFTDLQGFTQDTHRDEKGALRLLEEQEEVLGPTLAAHRGRKVKSMGDGTLLEFPNALDAVECSVDLQRSVHEHNLQEGAQPLRLRVGIHLGDVQERGADIFGDALNIASRIEPLAEVGGVCISAQVFDQVHNKVPFRLEKLGPKTLKGVHEPIVVYRVVLPWIGEGTAVKGPTFPRIAVLPFANISPDPKDEYFADGLTEELITILSQIPDLQVIARTSVMPYKSAPRPLAQIGTELGVTSVLEGSVRKAGEQLRITAQLIDVGSQSHKWANTYDRKLEDIFAVQTEVAKQIAGVLQIKMGEPENRRLEELPTVLPDSYLAYLKGQSLLSSAWTEAHIRAAKEQFELAVSIDPKNARAHSGLADATTLLGWNGFEKEGEEWNRVRRAYVARAIELDPDLAEAHCSRAIILWDEWDYAGAERELKIALSLNPSYSHAHREYAAILLDEGRVDEALRELRLAVELDPQSTSNLGMFASHLAQLRRVDEALSVVERLGRLAPDSEVYHVGLAWCYYGQSDFVRAMQECDRAAELDPETWKSRIPQAWIYALTGERETARQLLDAAKRMDRRYAKCWDLAVGFAFLGDLDEAFRLLFEGAKNHDMALQMIRIDPALGTLRQDPRFPELLKALNLA